MVSCSNHTTPSSHAGGRFTIEWIEVGAEACDSDFEPHYRSTTFYDMFTTTEPDAEAASPEEICPEGYTTINSQPGGLECLKIKPGKELLASRFETRRCGPPACARVHRRCCAACCCDQKCCMQSNNIC